MSSYISNIVNNEAELEKVARQAFKSVDRDKSGKIDSYELEKIMAQISSDMGAEPPTKEDVKEVMENLDQDRSGTIEFEEFKKLIIDILKALIE